MTLTRLPATPFSLVKDPICVPFSLPKPLVKVDNAIVMTKTAKAGHVVALFKRPRATLSAIPCLFKTFGNMEAGSVMPDHDPGPA